MKQAEILQIHIYISLAFLEMQLLKLQYPYFYKIKEKLGGADGDFFLFVCIVTAEAHVTDSRIIFGNWVEDGETNTEFELRGGYLHAGFCY